MIHIFIVNPYAGKRTFADDLREKLARIPNLEYFVFSTRYEGYEAELVKMIQSTFQGKKLRFYCCGGSGTMINMLNGFEDLTKAEVAWYPCGATNDFLKMFGSDYERFRSVEELITGEILPVDYICANEKIGVKSVSLGLDARVVKNMQVYQSMGILDERIEYVMAILHAIFQHRNDEYEMVVNNNLYTGIVTELFFGNGNIMAGNLLFSRNADIRDGEGEYYVTSVSGRKIMKYWHALQSGDTETVDSLSLTGTSSFMRIRRKDGVPFSVNIDGELTDEREEWCIRVVKQGLRLVVPKGVKLKSAGEVSGIAGNQNH